MPGAYDCTYQKYAFQDALLIAAPYDFGATKVSLLPREPVSKATAIAYAQILDTHSEIDFTVADTDIEGSEPNRERYSGCMTALNNGGDARFIDTCAVTLSLTPDGTVSEISLHHAVP